MKNILRRLRGVLGGAIAWGSAWFAGGLVYYLSWVVIATARESRWDLWGTLDVWFHVLQLAGATAVVGAVTGGAFAAYIALNFRNRRLEDLSPFRFAIGAGRNLSGIQVQDVQQLRDHLQELDNGRGAKLSPSSQRKYLNSLSNLFTRAQGEGYVPPGYNPVAAMMEKPTDNPDEPVWLEVPDAALYLEAARLYTPAERPANLWEPVRYAYPLIATLLLTGGRRAEVLGLRVQDISFDRRTVAFRRHEKRPNLKTRNAERVVPLWPQLEGILREYVFGGSGPMDEDGLLFPSPAIPGAMLTDERKLLENVGDLVGFGKELCRTKVFRHSYCSARLQTIDNGYPVAPWTVAKELGHGGRSLVDRVYGHLGEIRHRAEHLEYRVDQHEEHLGERLTALQVSHSG